MQSMRFWATSICAIACSLATPIAADAPPPAVQHATVDDPGHASIPVGIWPDSGGSALPLVIISHGNGGYLDSHADTAQALAQSGFVVVALTHTGDNYRDLSAMGKPDWLVDRSREVSKVIDFMFTRWEGRARLAPGRVGMFGFSAGATTALISIGGEPDLDRVPGHCAEQPEFVCTIMAPPRQVGGGSGRTNWVHDRRIAAAIVVAPGLGFAFTPSGLANVSVPVQLWSGQADQTVPYETNAAIIRRLLPREPEFHSVPGAVHYSFLKPCGPNTPAELCQDSAGFDRVAFHHEFNQSVIDFFRGHLTAAAQVRQP